MKKMCKMHETPSRGVLFGGRVREDGEMGLGGEVVMGARWGKLGKGKEKTNSFLQINTA